MKKLSVLFFATLVLAGCGGNLKEKIRVTGPVEYTMESFSRMRLETTVENDSRRTLRITEGKFRIHTSAGGVATVVLDEEIVVPRRSVMHIAVPLHLKLDNPLAALGALNGGMMISGEARVKVGAVSKKIGVKNERLDKFMSL